jgi:hypothetical protein
MHWFTAPGFLRPGDRVDFTCRGWDPEGVPFRLVWDKFNTDSIGPAHREFRESFAWDITPEDISQKLHIEIALVSRRAYHREGWYDDAVVMTYTVLPQTGGRPPP